MEAVIDLRPNGKNEVFFVDGADKFLSESQLDVLCSACHHFLKAFRINREVDVYISKLGELQMLAFQGPIAEGFHMPSSFSRDSSIVCAFIKPNGSLRSMITTIAHEMIHVWQVERGDLVGRSWKGLDFQKMPYEYQPWEVEAFMHQNDVAEWFFKNHKPRPKELQEMEEEAELEFESIIGRIKENAHIQQKENRKKKLAGIAKIAGAVGLGILLGI